MPGCFADERCKVFAASRLRGRFHWHASSEKFLSRPRINLDGR